MCYTWYRVLILVPRVHVVYFSSLSQVVICWVPGVIGNPTSPLFGTPVQNLRDIKMGYKNLKKTLYFSYSHQIIMDFKTVATKENTITTAAKDDAADLTENEDAVETSNTKNEELYIFTSHLICGAQGFQIF